MKNKLLRRISVGVAALAIVSTSAVAASFAKYQTTVTGNTDSVVVAKWDFNALNSTTGSGNTKTFSNFTLVPYQYSEVKLEADETTSSMLAPGTSGEFTVSASNSSEVDVEYSVEFVVSNKPENLTFYYEEACTNAIETDSTYVGTGVKYAYNFESAHKASTATGAFTMVGANNAHTSETYKIYWKWNYGTDTTGATDNTSSAQTMTVELTITGWQVEPNKVV